MVEKMFPTFIDYLKNKWDKNGGPYLATDIIIEHWDKTNNKQGIVLIERKNYPHGLALPGGIAEGMSLEENAIKEAREETGLEIKLYNSNQPFCVFSDPSQDPRAFIISVTYRAKGEGILKPKPEEDAKNARVFEYEEMEKLLKDEKAWAFPHHRKIVQLYADQIWRSDMAWRRGK